MTVVKCDMCGREIPNPSFRIYGAGGHRFVDDSFGEEKYEFCDDCYMTLKNFVKTYFAATKSGTAVSLTEEKK